VQTPRVRLRVKGRVTRELRWVTRYQESKGYKHVETCCREQKAQVETQKVDSTGHLLAGTLGGPGRRYWNSPSTITAFSSLFLRATSSGSSGFLKKSGVPGLPTGYEGWYTVFGCQRPPPVALQIADGTRRG
jgi:hypothetical protein